MKVRSLLPVFCLMAVAATSPVCAQWSFDADLGMSHDDNLGNARAGDTVSDRTLVASVAATQARYLDDGASVSWGGHLDHENHAHFPGLNKVAVGVSLAYRKKLDVGALAPWWRASWSSSALTYGENARNGWQHQADIGVGKRISERYNLGVSFRLEKRTASSQQEVAAGISGDAFSQMAQSINLRAEYAAYDNTVLSLDGQLRHGDVVATSHRYRQVFLVSKAIARDIALGADMYAYRLSGNSLALNIGLTQMLSRDAQAKFSLQRMLTHGEGGNNYARNIVALSWLGSF